MRISDWSSDVCSSDLREFIVRGFPLKGGLAHDERAQRRMPDICPVIDPFRQGIDDIEIFPEGRPTPVDSGLHRRAGDIFGALEVPHHQSRSEEHTSELQSLMRISYAYFCLKKKNNKN